jgi:hypothetical protein
LSGVRTHNHSVRASEDSSCLRPRGHCDRLGRKRSSFMPGICLKGLRKIIKNLSQQSRYSRRHSNRAAPEHSLTETERDHMNEACTYRKWEGRMRKTLKSTIFWDTTPCSPLKVNQRFGRIYYFHLQGRMSRTRYPRESSSFGFPFAFMMISCSDTLP